MRCVNHDSFRALRLPGGIATIIASYLARARGSGEPEASVERVRDLALSGADQVLALTEDSVNRILRTRREALGASHLLSTWSKDSFKAEFNPLTVRILSNGKVIVFVDIAHAESGSRV